MTVSQASSILALPDCFRDWRGDLWMTAKVKNDGPETIYVMGISVAVDVPPGETKEIYVRVKL